MMLAVWNVFTLPIDVAFEPEVSMQTLRILLVDERMGFSIDQFYN
jgi:hypothetical protein